MAHSRIVPVAVEGTVALILATGLVLAAPPQTRPPAQVPARLRGLITLGFSPAAARAERQVEEKFKAIPSAEEARKHHRFLTAEPHPAGSERNYQLALYIADLWKQQGWEDVTIRRYDVLSSSPREVSAQMVSPIQYQLGLREDPYDVDPDTKNPRVRSGYLGFSASGEVTAPVVYAHSGNPQDYELLRRNGIAVKGKIVLVRYSNPYSYRGFKALTAEREGAAALLIYSDPAEDGYSRGKVFPDGPRGPASHIQRGAITYDFLVPGDPLTPGWASVPGARRIPVVQAVSVPKIMAVAISWRDARPLLEHMDGPKAPKDWQGALPITYRLGGDRCAPAPEGGHGHQRAPELRRRGAQRRRRGARRVGPAREPSRRLGIRRRGPFERHRFDARALPGLRSAQATGHSPAADAGDLQLGRRRVRADGLDRMGRAVRRGASEEARRLPQRGLIGFRAQFRGGGRGVARAAAGRSQPQSPGPFGCVALPCVESILREGAARGPQHPARHRCESGEYANRQRFRPHGLPQFSRPADHWTALRRPLRRLSLDVRQFLLDESFR